MHSLSSLPPLLFLSLFISIYIFLPFYYFLSLFSRSLSLLFSPIVFLSFSLRFSVFLSLPFFGLSRLQFPPAFPRYMLLLGERFFIHEILLNTKAFLATTNWWCQKASRTLRNSFGPPGSSLHLSINLFSFLSIPYLLKNHVFSTFLFSFFLSQKSILSLSLSTSLPFSLSSLFVSLCLLPFTSPPLSLSLLLAQQSVNLPPLKALHRKLTRALAISGKALLALKKESRKHGDWADFICSLYKSLPYLGSAGVPEQLIGSIFLACSRIRVYFQ